MDVNRLPPISTWPTSPSTLGESPGEAEVIDLKQIKTILYLGLRCQIEEPGEPAEHLVDTFA